MTIQTISPISKSPAIGSTGTTVISAAYEGNDAAASSSDELPIGVATEPGRDTYVALTDQVHGIVAATLSASRLSFAGSPPASRSFESVVRRLSAARATRYSW